MELSLGQCSTRGIKSQNEDSCGIRVPQEPLLSLKGAVIAIADGVGAAEGAKEAAENCILGFLSDYYSTPESWSTLKSGEKVIQALNSWMYGQANSRFKSENSFVSTFSVLVLKSSTGYVFHVGDSRVYRLRDGKLRQLTKDHTISTGNRGYLARAMGADISVHVDSFSFDIRTGDLYLLTTDGVHNHLSPTSLAALACRSSDLEENAKKIVQTALKNQSEDNLTVQLAKIVLLGKKSESEVLGQLVHLRFPPPLAAGQQLDQYTILKEIHTSPTVQIYLAEDQQTGQKVALKTPSVNFEDDPEYIERFVHEEWVGNRISNEHVLKVISQSESRSTLYYATEFLEGQSLEQWALDHPFPELSKVREIAKQIESALRAFHRKDMVHQDVKPENLMIDSHDRVKLIDFGCVHVAGLREIYSPLNLSTLQGTANYIAPELFEGFLGTPKSDMYSFGVVLYWLLTQKFPYKAVKKAEPHRSYQYRSARSHNPEVPIWVDRVLQKAVHPKPEQRYESYSELLFELSNPNPKYVNQKLPLIEREPLLFWKWLAWLMIGLNLVFFILLVNRP